MDQYFQLFWKKTYFWQSQDVKIKNLKTILIFYCGIVLLEHREIWEKTENWYFFGDFMIWLTVVVLLLDFMFVQQVLLKR